MRGHLPILTAAVVLLAAGIPAFAGASSADGLYGSGTALVVKSSPVTSSSTDESTRSAAVRKCRSLRSPARKRSCLLRVKKRFAGPVIPQQGPIAARIDVRDKYFSPALVSIQSGQSILWSWNAVNADAHNVDLVGPPPGVRRLDFSTPNSPSVGFEFRRTFTVPGAYSFVCSIHHNMTMQVEVSG